MESILDYLDFTLDYPEAFDDNPTMYGILLGCWEDVSAHWHATTTKKGYARDYARDILPLVKEKALKDYTREDLDQIIDVQIRKLRENDSRVWNESTRQHFRRIIKRIFEVAEDRGFCTDILWGTQYALSEGSSDSDLNRKEFVVLRKSLTISEEIFIVNKIMTDITQDGEYFGIALMFCLGTRNQEACRIKFNDIRMFSCDQSQYAAYIYSTPDKTGTGDKFSGKTSNMVRIIPVPKMLSDLLKRRRRFLIDKVISGEIVVHKDLISETETREEAAEKFVDGLYIACHGSDYVSSCSPADLTRKGNEVLKAAKVNQELLALIDLDIRRPGRTEEGLKEKDPTAYLFRRNLGSHLYFLGLNDNEIQYIMGHDIEYPNDERYFYRNEEKLYPIALKMRLRPLVNPMGTQEETTVENGTKSLRNTFTAKINMPAVLDNEHASILIRQRELGSKTEIQIKTSSGTSVSGNCVRFNNMEPYSDTINITRVYHEQYARALKRHRNTISDVSDIVQSE